MITREDVRYAEGFVEGLRWGESLRAEAPGRSLSAFIAIAQGDARDKAERLKALGEIPSASTLK